MMPTVHLICMPFQPLSLAPLSIPLLGTILRENGITIAESYLHFDFARLLSTDTYYLVSERKPSNGLISELLFSEDYYGSLKHPDMLGELEESFGPLENRRVLCRDFKKICLKKIETFSAPIVGFTTSANQLFPSIWLARQIKKMRPDVCVVFGGAACSSPMGKQILESYQEIDIVVGGFGEALLLDIAKGRCGTGRRFIEDTKQVELNSLPIPKYSSYIEQAHDASLTNDKMMLAYESSRGCWWGQRHHCTFCGVNQMDLHFNEKSSDRVVDEIRSIWEQYQINLFATDAILSNRHIKEVMPRLAAYDAKPSLFYEVKSSMGLQDVDRLKAANVQWVQPGIESLSNSLLKHLKKGVSVIQNIAFLKWCRDNGIRVSWNLLCGIPGESPVDYEEQIALMAAIVQLPPPQGVTPIRVDRYSPYFKSPEKYGWSDLVPIDPYQHLHPMLSSSELNNIAYHFDAVGGDVNVTSYLGALQDAVKNWRKQYYAGEGVFWDESLGVIIISDGQAKVIKKTAQLALVLKESYTIILRSDLLSLPGVNDNLVDELVEWGVLYREGDKYVNLAVSIGAS